ncbi:MAG: flagellar basal body rod C-terminal domain-containing protein, partial [Paracoccaceae bacterium]
NGALGSGSLAAHIHMVNLEIPELAREMDELVNMAVDLPDMFNATSNNLAVEFGLFVQSGSGLAVSPTLLTGAPLSNGTAIDGGSISLKPPTAIGQIITPFSHLENKSLDVISSVASRLKSSETQIESQTLQKQAIQGVFSKSGVQLEDEAFNLVTLQNAFEANACVLKIVDELHKALVRM